MKTMLMMTDYSLEFIDLIGRQGFFYLSINVRNCENYCTFCGTKFIFMRLYDNKEISMAAKR